MLVSGYGAGSRVVFPAGGLFGHAVKPPRRLLQPESPALKTDAAGVPPQFGALLRARATQSAPATFRWLPTAQLLIGWDYLQMDGSWLSYEGYGYHRQKNNRDAALEAINQVLSRTDLTAGAQQDAVLAIFQDMTRRHRAYPFVQIGRTSLFKEQWGKACKFLKSCLREEELKPQNTLEQALNRVAAVALLIYFTDQYSNSPLLTPENREKLLAISKTISETGEGNRQMACLKACLRDPHAFDKWQEAQEDKKERERERAELQRAARRADRDLRRARRMSARVNMMGR